MKPRILSSIAFAILCGHISYGDDWPQVNGLNHDRISTESIEIGEDAWKPSTNWQVKCNGGFSSFVVGEGKAFTVLLNEIEGDLREIVVALDSSTGKLLWNTGLGKASYDPGGDRGTPTNKGGDGPRATAVVSNGSVFVYGSQFDLYCLDSSNGKLLWKQDILNDFGGKMIRWQNAMSPLVHGDRVFVSGGGERQAILAFSVSDGSLLWQTASDGVSHATPVLATIDGIEQALFVLKKEVISVDPETGKELWTYPFKIGGSIAASPVVYGNLIHVTAGYGTGAAVIEVTQKDKAWDVKEHWRIRGNGSVASHWSTPVAHEGHLYGLYSYKEFGDGELKCIDMLTGKIEWEKKGFGQGQLIMADNKLFVLSDFGRMSVVEPTPVKYKELAEADVIEGKCWATPVISDGHMFIRSTISGISLEL